MYRCDDPCGWDELALTASDIQVEGAKGAGKLVDLVLSHQEKVMGEPIEFTQSISRVLQPQVAGAPLTLRVSRLVMGDGRLAATLTYELGEVERGGRTPPSSGGGGSKKGTGSKKGSGSKKDGGSKKGSSGGGGRR